MIMDFVNDAADDFDGTMPKIGTLLLRAIKGSCDDAVEAVKGMIPCYCACCIRIPDVDDIKTSCFDNMVTQSKNQLKDKIKNPGGGISIPDVVVEKLDPMFDKFDINADVGEPKTKSVPEPQTMGASG